MADCGTYGQFGQAIYDHQEKEWHFERSSKEHSSFHPIGEAKLVIPSTNELTWQLRELDGKEGPSKRREKQVRALVRIHPELQPTSTLLPK